MVNACKEGEMKRLLCILLLVFSVTIFSACNPQGSTDQPQGTKFEELESTEWQYVVLGDSSSWGYPEILADKLEQELGVSVEVILRSQGSDHSSRLLGRLQSVDSLRDEISNAELITIVIPLNVFETPLTLYVFSPEQCGGEDHQDCLREAMEIFKNDTEGIIAELVSLVDMDSTVILAHTRWQYNVTLAKQTGDFEVINMYFKELNSHVISVCEEYGIPVARVYEAFMGTDDSKNPEEDGLINDGIHTTPEGQVIIADLLYDLGK